MAYNFNSTGNNTTDRIIQTFDKQIKIEYKKARGEKEKCPSFWDKLIFLESLYLSYQDWKKIRDNSYYNIVDQLEGIQRSKFIYFKIIEYKKSR